MRRTSFDDIVAGIDRHLPYLHKERWAARYAELMDVVRSTTGDEQNRAKQAVRDHYQTQSHPQTSRAALIEDARRNHGSENGLSASTEAWSRAALDAGNRADRDPDYASEVGKRLY